MKNPARFPAILLAGLASVLAPEAAAALLVHYTFEGDATLAQGSVIVNHAPGATQNGTFNIGTGADNTFAFEASGAPGGTTALRLTPGNDNYVNLEASHIDTGLTAATLNITPATEYTAMAWVRFASQIGDNIIFGQAGSNSLHLGSRGSAYHSGHWADDYTTGTTGTSEWVHLAFTNTAAGVQEIFVNGVSIGSSSAGTGGAMVTTKNVLLGTFGAANGSFNGWLDDVKIFDSRLSQVEIQQASVIPEASTFLATALGGIMLLGRRRRPQA